MGRPNPALPFGWLGYVEVTAPQTGITVGAGVTDLTGLSVTVVAGVARRIRITALGFITRTVADGDADGYIQEGATVIGTWGYNSKLLETGTQTGHTVITPAAGSHTYKMTLQMSSGTGTAGLDAGPGYAASLLVEDIGPA